MKIETTLIWTVHTKQAKSQARKIEERSHILRFTYFTFIVSIASRSKMQTLERRLHEL